MKSKTYRKLFLCILITMILVAPSFASDEEAGQIILNNYTAQDKLAQPRQTAIRAFESNVTDEEVPQDVKEIVSAYNSLTIRALNIDGIHILDLYKDDGSKKPLVIYLHGGGESKVNFYTVLADQQKKLCGKVAFNEYAKAGFRVVTMDAPGNGDDDTGPRNYLEVIAEGVHYIDKIIEYFNTIEDVDATRFALQGNSIGANTTFAYVVHGSYKPAAIIADCGVADFTKVAEGPLYDCMDKTGMGKMNIMTRQQIRNFAKLYSPSQWPEKFEDIYILAGCGLNDALHPAKSMKDFEANLKQLGFKNIKFVYEKNHGHWPTDYIIKNSTSVLKKNLLQ